MIPIRQEVLHEVEIIGGTAALIQINHWNPHREDELKFKIISADLSDNPLSEWSFNSEEAAWAAFKNLCENVA